jgi:thiamine transporter ThiT
MVFFVGAIPVALIFGEGAIGVLFPLFLLLYLVMFILFIVGCVMRQWKMNWRATSGSLFFGLLVAAGSVCALYAIGFEAKAWMTPAVVAIVVMALISYGALSRIRILDQSEDPAGQEEKAGPEENLHEE